MRKLLFRLFILVILSSSAFSCASKRITTEKSTGDGGYLENLCDSLSIFKSLYISRVDAIITIEEENYDAKISLYYVPDSLLFLSATSAGFEIVRIGIVPDSTVYINRIDKMVYIYRQSDMQVESPLGFHDIELLLNRSKQCEFNGKKRTDSLNILIDNSVQDIKKQVIISGASYKVSKFEFFQKKTSEYIVGERTSGLDFTIYSNFLVDNVLLRTSGGIVEYDKKIGIDLGFNRNKYDTIYF